MAAITYPPCPVNEPVTIAATQYGVFPQIFCWRGKRHYIRAIEACRTEVRRDRHGQLARHCFRVRTETATFELVQDVQRDTWQVTQISGETAARIKEPQRDRPR